MRIPRNLAYWVSVLALSLGITSPAFATAYPTKIVDVGKTYQFVLTIKNKVPVHLYLFGTGQVSCPNCVPYRLRVLKQYAKGVPATLVLPDDTEIPDRKVCKKDKPCKNPPFATSGMLLLPNGDLGKTLVAQGWLVASREGPKAGLPYVKSEYLKAEELAQSQRLGLWQLLD